MKEEEKKKTKQKRNTKQKEKKKLNGTSDDYIEKKPHDLYISPL
jgi:hypothetical protein